jgi:chromosome segregation ATPase
MREKAPSWKRLEAAVEELKEEIREERRACREMETICIETPKRLGELEAEVCALSARITLLTTEIREMSLRGRKRDA